MQNILIAISGLTPQIVTETLFALAVQKGITIDEIYIVTTKRGKQVLNGKDDNPNTPDVPFIKEMESLCKEYDIKKPKFTQSNIIVAEEETRELYDIKTDQENKLFPNKLAEIFNKLTQKRNTIIHASLSGGRKSMSAHLALVMSLFARSQDKLYHVITDEKYEFQNFYPKTRAEEKALVLAEVPFVRLRCVNDPLLKPNTKYSDLVERTQKKLNFLMMDAKLVVELKQLQVRYKDKSVRLTPVHISIYSLFVESQKGKGQGFSKKELTSVEFAYRLNEFLIEHFNTNLTEYKNKKEAERHWSRRGIDDPYFQSVKSKINSKIMELFENKDIAEEFIISKKGAYGNSIFYIKAPADKLGINYE